MLLPEDLDDEESGLSLASGLILVEDEDEVGFLIEDDEEEEEEDDYRPRPGEILGENDSRDDPGVARRSAAAERDRDDRSRYSRARSFGDRDDDYGYQRNDDDRRLASNEDYNLDNDSYGGGGRSDSIRARPTDGFESSADGTRQGALRDLLYAMSRWRRDR